MPRSFLVKKATTNYGQQFVKLHHHHHIGGRSISNTGSSGGGGGGDGQQQPPSSPTEGDCAPATVSVIGFNNANTYHKSVHRYSLSKCFFLYFNFFPFNQRFL